MRVEHIAMWVKDIERQKSFYEKYFQAQASSKYVNTQKNFQSYFLSFDGGARLELMQKQEIPPNTNDILKEQIGLIHFAISVGSRERVDQLTNEFKESGFTVLDGPRTTGDGYYESVILDPEFNRVEITI